MVHRGVRLERGHGIGLEVLPGVAGLLEGLVGVSQGGQQVGAVLLACSGVLVEDFLHVHRGPRCSFEVRELLMLHLLVSECPDELGLDVLRPEVSAQPGHDLLQFAHQSIVVFLLPLPFHQEEQVVAAVAGEPLSGGHRGSEIRDRDSLAVDGMTICF